MSGVPRGERDSASGLPGIAGARVLVTGGSRGIGRATVVRLAGWGASVGFCYVRSREAAGEAEAEARDVGHRWARSHGGPVPVVWSEAADLTREADVLRLFERVDREFGALDGFVGNAGIWNAEPRPLEALEPSEWREMVETNLTSIYRTTREAVRRLPGGGSVVLLSSTAGQRGEPRHAHYAATKGAILSFVKSLAVELGARDIRVNAVAPGWVDTDMSASVLRTEAREEVLREIPLRRVATAEDVAGPIVFLLSDLARHMTGAVLNVNGGSVLCG